MAWDFNKALNDPLVTVVSRNDSWGIFEIQLGTLSPIITIELGRHMDSDETKAMVSHAIHTPVQAGPYRTSRPFWDYPAYALHMAVSAFTQYYGDAVKAGHTPQDSWLVEV
jgi:hypothetical protein